MDEAKKPKRYDKIGIVRDPESRSERFQKNLEDGMSVMDAGRAAGYSDGYITRMIQKQGAGRLIKDQVVRRMAEARAKAPIHTDAIVGSLVEIMQASPADILPDHPALQKAKANGVDHLIKKISITPIKMGERSKQNEDGTTTTSPIIREKVELEMYSRLDAISQLRDNFGMKTEPRANSFEETKRQEVEREIQGIMVAEHCDEPTAAQLLLDNIGDAPHLVPVIQKYIKKHKKEPEQIGGTH